MVTTVAGVLELPVMRDARPEVIGGEKFLGRRVRWMHTTDGTDLTGLLKGGELILTDGSAFTGSPGEAQKYLDGLVRNGASGVMLSLLTDRPEAKAVIREAARSARIPVILLKDRVPFVDLTEAVHRVLLAGDLGESSVEHSIIDLFDRLSVENSDPAEVLRRASELLLAPVVYEDLQHRVVALSSASVPLERLLAQWRRRSSAVPTATPEREAEWPQAVYREHGVPAGRLVVPEALADPHAFAVLDRAAHVLDRCFENRGGSDSLRFRAAAQTFHDLRDPHYAAEPVAAIRAEAGGFEPGGAFLPVVVRSDCSHRPEVEEGHLPEGALLNAAFQAFRDADLKVLAGELSRTAIGCVLPIPESGEYHGNLKAVVDALRSGMMKSGIPIDECTIGIGPVGDSLHDAVTEGISEAASIAEAAADLDFARLDCYTSGDVRLRRLMRSISDDRRVRGFAAESLAELKRVAPESLHLLRRYIELNGNVAELARMLFLSRPSVYARLRRVEQIIGSSLNRIDTRMGLYIALLADSAGSTATTKIANTARVVSYPKGTERVS